jgi:hypothetical protein
MTKKSKQPNQKLKKKSQSNQMQQQENDNYQQFHPKVHILSSIQFTENEIQSLNKKLKYNPHFK